MAQRMTFPKHRRAGTAGFTLVELLVVIGIIGVLMAVLIPMVSRSMRQAKRTAQAQTLQTLSTSLEAYHSDYGMYPPVGGISEGAQVLYAALGKARPGKYDLDLSPPGAPDGVPDASSKTLDPYMKPDSVKSTPNGGGAFLDQWEKPILYYRSNPVNNIQTSPYYAAPAAYAPGTPNLPRWNINDNIGTVTPERFKAMTGDTSGDGAIGAGETAITVPFILWSAGPDSVYAPVGGLTKQELDACDDVTNFK